MGNPDLKPATIEEWEVGLNMGLVNRINLELVYSERNSKDQIALVPLITALTGFRNQWQNVGALNSTSLEASAAFSLVNAQTLKWKTRMNAYRIRHKISELNIQEQRLGPYKIAQGSDPYIGFGSKFFRSMDEFAEFYRNGLPENTYPDGTTIADFTLNSEGYVIMAGTEGTAFEEPQFTRNQDGTKMDVPIMDQNPDFQLGFTNTLNYRGLTLYFLLDWRQGGDIYNWTRHGPSRDFRSDIFDQSGKPEDQKKTLLYYYSFYNNGWYSSYFVEDATYLKIREMSLSYDIHPDVLSGFLKGVVKSLRISLVGRNLFTWTRYRGYDPESSVEGLKVFDHRWDAFSYPNYRTISGSLEVKF
jgi:hypothetical protein